MWLPSQCSAPCLRINSEIMHDSVQKSRALLGCILQLVAGQAPSCRIQCCYKSLQLTSAPQMSLSLALFLW